METKTKEHWEPREGLCMSAMHVSQSPEGQQLFKALELIAKQMNLKVEELQLILKHAVDKPKTETKPLTAIEEATKVIYGDREKTYGDPGKNLRTIAEYWSNHLKAKYDYSTPLTVDDVCVMMILLKQARLATTPKHRDSIVDTIGYAALADRVNVAEQEADERAADINPYVIQTADKK